MLFYFPYLLIFVVSLIKILCLINDTNFFYFNCIYYKKEYNDFYENLIIKIFPLNLLKIFLHREIFDHPANSAS